MFHLPWSFLFPSTDRDECQLSGSCHSNATCANTIGSYICTCKISYTGDGKSCIWYKGLSSSTLRQCFHRDLETLKTYNFVHRSGDTANDEGFPCIHEATRVKIGRLHKTMHIFLMTFHSLQHVSATKMSLEIVHYYYDIAHKISLLKIVV
jgi:hypothetical protein